MGLTKRQWLLASVVTLASVAVVVTAADPLQVRWSLAEWVLRMRSSRKAAFKAVFRHDMHQSVTAGGSSCAVKHTHVEVVCLFWPVCLYCTTIITEIIQLMFQQHIPNHVDVHRKAQQDEGIRISYASLFWLLLLWRQPAVYERCVEARRWPTAGSYAKPLTASL